LRRSIGIELELENTIDDDAVIDESQE